MTALPAPRLVRYRLGDYREYPPPPPLGVIAEGLWTHRVAPDATLVPGAMHRVLPDLALSLAFRCRRDRSGRPQEGRLLVIGPKSRPHVFALEPGWETTAVRLKLEWAGPACDLLPSEHGDAETDVSELGPAARRLFDRLGETRSASGAEAALSDAILRWASRRDATGGPAARALDLVRRTGGTLPVERIAPSTGTSPRHLRRAVQRDAGISLKRYARVTRLLRAVTAADAVESPPWARIAAEAGFADQSHLIRECRSLTGLSPAAVHRERRAEAETSNPG